MGLDETDIYPAIPGESQTYGSVAGNSRISVSVHRELLY